MDWSNLAKANIDVQNPSTTAYSFPPQVEVACINNDCSADGDREMRNIEGNYFGSVEGPIVLYDGSRSPRPRPSLKDEDIHGIQAMPTAPRQQHSFPITRWPCEGILSRPQVVMICFSVVGEGRLVEQLS